MRTDQDLPEPGHSTMHPKQLGAFYSGVAASDSDIAQGSVAEVHQLVARVGAPSPGAQMSFQQAPTRRAMRLGRRNAHGTSPSLFASTRRSTRPFCTGICPSCRVTRAGGSTWLARGNAAMAFVPRCTVRQRPAHRRNRARGRRLARVPCRPPRVRTRFLQCG